MTWSKVNVRIRVRVFRTNSRNITQKLMIPKCSKLVYGMILGYPRSDMVLGLKGHNSRLELGLGYSNTTWVRTSNFMSAYTSYWLH